MSNEVQENATEQSNAGKRRAFLKGTAAVAAAGVGYLTNFKSPSEPAAVAAAAAPPGFAPYSTPIVKLLPPQAAALLTPAAAKITKGDVHNLRLLLNGHAKGGAGPSLTTADINSLTAAWDAREEQIAKTAGFQAAMNDQSTTQHAWVTFGVEPAHADTTFSACCCCCPCCTAAAVTEPLAA